MFIAHVWDSMHSQGHLRKSIKSISIICRNVGACIGCFTSLTWLVTDFCSAWNLHILTKMLITFWLTSAQFSRSHFVVICLPLCAIRLCAWDIILEIVLVLEKPPCCLGWILCCFCKSTAFELSLHLPILLISLLRLALHDRFVKVRVGSPFFPLRNSLLCHRNYLLNKGLFWSLLFSVIFSVLLLLYKILLDLHSLHLHVVSPPFCYIDNRGQGDLGHRFGPRESGTE